MRSQSPQVSPEVATVANTRTVGKKHTRNHKNCPVCAEADMLLIQIDSDFSRLSFKQARHLWMELRRRGHLKARTHESNEGYLDALEKFFGPMRLCDITPGNVRAYQVARTANLLEIDGRDTRPWHRPAGHSIINHEISALGQLLKHPKLWERIKPYYFPLAIAKWSPREVLSEEDEEELFKVAALHPEAALAYWVACITNNTTAAGIELRGLRFKNIFLRDKKEISEIYIPADAVKNTSRPRKIALNNTARWAVEQCYRRALKLGAHDPDHYLFPFRAKRNHYDPTKAASRWFLRDSWNKLRDATGFTDLNPHDLRHQCITRLLEHDVQPETVRAIAGHVTEQMMQYYSHQRIRTKYNAVMAIESGVKSGPRVVRKRA
jgi:integrase